MQEKQKPGENLFYNFNAKLFNYNFHDILIQILFLIKRGYYCAVGFPRLKVSYSFWCHSRSSHIQINQFGSSVHQML